MNPPDRLPLSQLLRAAARELDATPLPPWSSQADVPVAAPVVAPARRARCWPSLRLPVPWPAAWAGATACVVVVCFSGWLMLHNPDSLPDMRRARASDFLPLAAADRWTQLGRDGADAAWLVTTELPSERLASLGLPYDPSRAGDNVRAELLLHPSGEVLAVRFLR